MENFYIITNRLRDKRWTYTNKIKKYLESKGKVCHTMPKVQKENEKYEVPDGTDCIIVLGGDGTMLHAAKDTFMQQIPMIGINIGTLGYLADIEKNAIFPALDQLIADDYVVERRTMLYGKVVRNGKVIVKDTALNDIVVSREGHRNLVCLETYVGGTKLNKYRADGLVVATPTGSTGYSLSAGGPIIAPEADLILLTPLAPQSMINRSVILPSKEDITVKIGFDKYGGTVQATVMFDGTTRVDIESGDEVIIKKSNKDTLIAKISDTSFLDVLYTKLNPIAIKEVLQ